MKNNEKSYLQEGTRLFRSIFAFGFHDTKITKFEIVNEYIKISFGEGIYNLDKRGREKDLTKPIAMFIKIDNTFSLNLMYCFDITSVSSRKMKYFNEEPLFTKNALNGAIVYDLFYSTFSSMIMIHAKYKLRQFYITILDCMEVWFEYI